MPRKLGEVIGSTVGAVASVVVSYPLGEYIIKVWTAWQSG